MPEMICFGSFELDLEIETLPRRGYRLVAPIEQESSQLPEPGFGKALHDQYTTITVNYHVIEKYGI
jgi:DNA-binding winged helix-turn-helix (wHTH) protein